MWNGNINTAVYEHDCKMSTRHSGEDSRVEAGKKQEFPSFVEPPVVVPVILTVARFRSHTFSVRPNIIDAINKESDKVATTS